MNKRAKRHEYKVISMGGMSDDQVEETLNSHAADGWRLTATPRWCCNAYVGEMTTALVLERTATAEPS